MAGIRGRMPWRPPSEKKVAGIFRAGSTASMKKNNELINKSMSSERVAPVKRDNKIGRPNRSHYKNNGLKRGTSNRG